MKRDNKTLYEKIMRNISKNLKHILDENIQRFDVTDYQDDEIMDNQIVDNTLYTVKPETLKELKKIVAKRIYENPECPLLNDIDTSLIDNMIGLFLSSSTYSL